MYEDPDLQGMRQRICIHSRRAGILRIQGLRERAAEMQGMPPEPQECSKAGT